MVHGPDDKTEPPEKILGCKTGSMAANGLAKAHHGGLLLGREDFCRERQWLCEYSAQQPSARAIVGDGIVA